ncbi:hypothetical protein ACA910_006025 [Epithemia clementina (nom. ined.)]
MTMNEPSSGAPCRSVVCSGQRNSGTDVEQEGKQDRKDTCPGAPEIGEVNDSDASGAPSQVTTTARLPSSGIITTCSSDSDSASPKDKTKASEKQETTISSSLLHQRQGFQARAAFVDLFSPSLSSTTASTASKTKPALTQAKTNSTSTKIAHPPASSSSRTIMEQEPEKGITSAETTPAPPLVGIAVPVSSSCVNKKRLLLVQSISTEIDGEGQQKQTSPGKSDGPRYITRSFLKATKTPPSASTDYHESKTTSPPLSPSSSCFPEDGDDDDSTPASFKKKQRRRPKRGTSQEVSAVVCKDPSLPTPHCQSKTIAKPINTNIFPFILARFLREVGASHPKLVHWADDGQSFFITAQPKMNCKRIGELVAPYFKHNNYDALRRQLNLYGFQRLQNGPNKGSWFNPLFHRDRLTNENIATVRVGCRSRNTSKGSKGTNDSTNSGELLSTSTTSKSASEKPRYQSYASTEPETAKRDSMKQKRAPSKKVSPHPPFAPTLARSSNKNKKARLQKQTDEVEHKDKQPQSRLSIDEKYISTSVASLDILGNQAFSCQISDDLFPDCNDLDALSLSAPRTPKSTFSRLYQEGQATSRHDHTNGSFQTTFANGRIFMSPVDCTFRIPCLHKTQHFAECQSTTGSSSGRSVDSHESCQRMTKASDHHNGSACNHFFLQESQQADNSQSASSQAGEVHTTPSFKSKSLASNTRKAIGGLTPLAAMIHPCLSPAIFEPIVGDSESPSEQLFLSPTSTTTPKPKTKSDHGSVAKDDAALLESSVGETAAL